MADRQVDDIVSLSIYSEKFWAITICPLPLVRIYLCNCIKNNACSNTATVPHTFE